MKWDLARAAGHRELHCAVLHCFRQLPPPGEGTPYPASFQVVCPFPRDVNKRQPFLTHRSSTACFASRVRASAVTLWYVLKKELTTSNP